MSLLLPAHKAEGAMISWWQPWWRWALLATVCAFVAAGGWCNRTIGDWADEWSIDHGCTPPADMPARYADAVKRAWACHSR